MLVLPATGSLLSDPVILHARIDDQSGVQSVTAWVKGERDSAYNPIEMRPAEDGTFVAELAPSAARGAQVFYFLEATDRLGNGPRRSGSARTPFVARLGTAAAAAAPSHARRTTLLGAALAVCLVCLTILTLNRRQRREGATQRELQFWRELLAPMQELKGPALQQAIDDLCAQKLSAPDLSTVGRLEVVRRLKQLRESDPVRPFAPAVMPSPAGKAVAKTEVHIKPAPLERFSQKDPLEEELAIASEGFNPRRSRGITMVELLIVLAILGVGLGMAGLYLKPVEAPLRTGAELVDALMRHTRARSMANTMAHRIRPTTNRRLEVEYASSCAAMTWTPVNRMSIDLPRDVTMSSTMWSVCFTSRGLASDNFTIELSHPGSGSQELEVMLGGAVRWLPQTGHVY
jgi:prepilin-type N-terminal cleavage/methylation domain-containing protein